MRTFPLGYFMFIDFYIHCTMVGIESFLTKKMGYAVQKWLKTLDFGTNCNIRGMKFNGLVAEYSIQFLFEGGDPVP